MIATLVRLLEPLAPVVLEAIKSIIEDLLAKRDPSASIRHAEAEAARTALHLPLKP